MKIYLLPGLGYDCRIFVGLEFVGQIVKELSWIDPIGDESFSAYAHRMCSDVLDEKEEVILIGHSLGGMIAQEISIAVKPKLIVLISSIRSRNEIPFSMKTIAPLGIHHLFTKGLCLKTVKYWGAGHDLPTKADQRLFKSMVGKQSNTYLQWALKAVSKWNAPEISAATKVVQIHGSKDKTFPAKLIRQADHVVEGGSHMMVYKKPKTISELLNKEIRKTQQSSHQQGKT